MPEPFKKYIYEWQTCWYIPDCPSYLGVRTEDNDLKPVEWHMLFNKTISQKKVTETLILRKL